MGFTASVICSKKPNYKYILIVGNGGIALILVHAT